MSNNDIIPEFLKSFGVEIEFLYPTQNKMAGCSAIKQVGAYITYDASAETQTQICRETGLTLIESPYILSKSNGEKLGGEIVTGIWNFRLGTPAILTRLGMITSALINNGEPSKSTRGGIHFHIAFTNELDSLKRAVLLGGYLEKTFFTLGGMGYEHRGMSSDSIYYRPITRSGPIVVPVPGGWAQNFTIEQLVGANSLNEFFIRYGDALTWAGTKYPIPRYHWLNLVNLVVPRKTIEFRVFNITHDANKILSVLLFCKAFAEFCVNTPWKNFLSLGFDQENSVFDNIPIVKTLERTEKFLNLTDIPIRNKDTLIDMICSTPQPILEERFVRSHLHDRHSVPVHWEYGNYEPEKISTSKICHPKYEDFYTRGGRNTSSLGGPTRGVRVFDNFSELRRASVSSRR